MVFSHSFFGYKLWGRHDENLEDFTIFLCSTSTDCCDIIGVNGPLNPSGNKMIPTQVGGQSMLWCVNASEKRFSLLGSIACQRFVEIGEFGWILTSEMPLTSFLNGWWEDTFYRVPLIHVADWASFAEVGIRVEGLTIVFTMYLWYSPRYMDNKVTNRMTLTGREHHGKNGTNGTPTNQSDALSLSGVSL